MVAKFLEMLIPVISISLTKCVTSNLVSLAIYNWFGIGCCDCSFVYFSHSRLLAGLYFWLEVCLSIGLLGLSWHYNMLSLRHLISFTAVYENVVFLVSGNLLLYLYWIVFHGSTCYRAFILAWCPDFKVVLGIGGESSGCAGFWGVLFIVLDVALDTLRRTCSSLVVITHNWNSEIRKLSLSLCSLLRWLSKNMCEDPAICKIS